MHGWRPRGTTLAAEPGWDGNYEDNAGQEVSDADAAELALALRAALRQPENARLARMLSEVADISAGDDDPATVGPLARELDPLAREACEQLIEFCRSGFVIT